MDRQSVKVMVSDESAWLVQDSSYSEPGSDLGKVFSSHEQGPSSIDSQTEG